MSGFTDFHYQGQTYDLSYLKPMQVGYVQAAGKRGETERYYRCIVEFSGHCLTKVPNQAKGETLAIYTMFYQKKHGFFALNATLIQKNYRRLFRNGHKENAFLHLLTINF